jgi:hypothetical protein
MVRSWRGEIVIVVGCEVEGGMVGRVVEGVAGTTSEIKQRVLASVPVGVAVCYPKERFSSYLDKWALKIHNLGFGECEGRRKNIDALGIGGTIDDIRVDVEALRWKVGTWAILFLLGTCFGLKRRNSLEKRDPIDHVTCFRLLILERDAVELRVSANTPFVDASGLRPHAQGNTPVPLLRLFPFPKQLVYQRTDVKASFVPFFKFLPNKSLTLGQ